MIRVLLLPTGMGFKCGWPLGAHKSTRIPRVLCIYSQFSSKYFFTRHCWCPFAPPLTQIPRHRPNSNSHGSVTQIFVWFISCRFFLVFLCAMEQVVDILRFRYLDYPKTFVLCSGIWFARNILIYIDKYIYILTLNMIYIVIEQLFNVIGKR